MKESLLTEPFVKAISAGKFLSSILPLQTIHVITDAENGYSFSINADAISSGETILISFLNGKRIHNTMPINGDEINKGHG
jgi:hypothetical protein